MEVNLDLQAALNGLQKVRYSELVSSMIIVYDHAISLDQEIQLIWKSSWSFGKCLFLANRYYALFVVIFNNYVLFGPGVNQNLCSHWFRWQGVTGLVTFAFGELILQMRLYALYNLNRKVLVIMISTFLVAFVASASIMSVVLARVQVASIPIHLPNISTSICTLTNLGSIPFFYTYWIPMMISETLLCTLVIVRAIERMREDKRMKSTSRWIDSSRELAVVMIRDSILYFLVLFAVYLINTIIFVQSDVVDLEAAISYAVSLSCVMGSRLCLNVRGMVSTAHNYSLSSEGSHHGKVPSHMHHPCSSPISTFPLRPIPASSAQKWPVIVFSRSDCGGEEEEPNGLTEHELAELRGMKPEV